MLQLKLFPAKRRSVAVCSVLRASLSSTSLIHRDLRIWSINSREDTRMTDRRKPEYRKERLQDM